MVLLYMHDLFHIPIVGYGYAENGKQILNKIVTRFEEGCPKCLKLYDSNNMKFYVGKIT